MNISFIVSRFTLTWTAITQQDSSVPRHTIYQMARLFSLAGAVIVGNIIHDYTAVLYVHGRINNTKFLNIVSSKLPQSHTWPICWSDPLYKLCYTILETTRAKSTKTLFYDFKACIHVLSLRSP